MDDVSTDSDDCTTDCAYVAAIGSGPGGTLSEAGAQEPFDSGEGCFAVSAVESAVASCISFASLVAVCLVGFFDGRNGVVHRSVKDNSF